MVGREWREDNSLGIDEIPGIVGPSGCCPSEIS